MSRHDSLDLKQLCKCLESCLEDEGDIQIQPFLHAFKELNKFCTLLGGVLFNAVSDEISSKSKILEDFLEKDGSIFSSLLKMIEYETKENVLNNGVCGCRTLLRLLWGLDFVRTFFEKAYKLNHDDSTSAAGREAYDLTLANHHGFFIRQGAHICLWTLPTKKELLKRLFGDEIEEALEAIPDTINAFNRVYNKMQEIYGTNNLLDLR